jgi:hypothetical protein
MPTGKDGEAFTRSPINAGTIKPKPKIPPANIPRRFARARLLFLSRVDRPSLIGVILAGQRSVGFGMTGSLSRDEMAASDDDLVYGSFTAVFRSEFPLLYHSFDKEVVTFVVRGGERGQFVIKGQVVPICIGELFAVAIPVTVVFCHSDVGDSGSRWQEPRFRLSCERARDLNPIFLHFLLSLKFNFFKQFEFAGTNAGSFRNIF